ncbi:putative ribonuclease H-like domain-containing protein [Tanacetum coccineum]
MNLSSGHSIAGFITGFCSSYSEFLTGSDTTCTEDNIDAGDSKIEAEFAQDYFVLPIWSSYTSTIKSSKANNAGEEPNKHPDLKTYEKPVDKEDQEELLPIQDSGCLDSVDFALWEEIAIEQMGLQNKKEKEVSCEKALYGLHQAPRAWYATLSTFLLKNGYRRGTIDKTLFIKKDKNDIMLVQVYVDDIIFGSTKRDSWCDKFEALMRVKFKIKTLKKFDFASVKAASTPIKTQKPLVKDKEASEVDSVLVLGFRSLQRLPSNAIKESLDLFLGNSKKQTICGYSTYRAECVAAANLLINWDIKESLQKDNNGTKSALIAELLKSCITKYTDSAIFVPMGKVSTAKETLKKIPPRV